MTMKETPSTSEATEEIIKKPKSHISSRERWYGMALLFVLIAGGGALFGMIGWWGYTYIYTPKQEVKQSIQAMPYEAVSEKMNPPVDVDPVQVAVKEDKQPTAEETLANIKKIPVLVLNGGGAGGSAGGVATIIQKEGFQKVTVGNTQKDYTGVTIYFASGEEGGAAELKKLLLKQYPKIESKGSVAGDKETSGAPLVVIIGK